MGKWGRRNSGELAKVKKERGSAFERLMSIPERVGAWAVGLSLSGGGAVAVFATENQAGSTALILVGAVFLIVGVQGTPISRASKDAIELQKRAAKVARETEEIADEQGAERAENFLSGALAAEPQLRESPAVYHVEGSLYEIRARQAFERIAARGGMHLAMAGGRAGYDIGVKKRDKSGLISEDLSFVVEAKYRSSGYSLMGSELLKLLDRVRHSLNASIPVLIVSNVDLSIRARELIEQRGNRDVVFVKWNSENDDEALAEAVKLLLGEK